MGPRHLTILCVLASWPSTASAEEPAAGAPPASEQAVVAARLLAPVPPEYPAEALAEGLHADVTIRVTVGPDGAVIAATWLEGGPAIFVEPALAAARALRFEPATVDGRAVESTLPATFHFEPPAPAEGEPGDYEVIVVEAKPASSEDSHAVVRLGEQVLDRAAGQDLGEALAQVPGVTAARGTASSTKPIIRGQYERRLLLLFDGVRHESQKWGLDHAPEIDPFAAGSIEVIKGAAGVRYGPDAIGGVVLVEPPPLRAEPGVGGKAQLVAVSNGAGATGAFRLDGASERWPGVAVRLEGNYGRAAATRTPTYVLGNTGTEEWNLGATLGWRRDRTALDVSYHRYDSRGGVCYCVKNSTPEDFLGQLDADAPVSADVWTTTPAIDRPFQAVSHDVALARAVVALPGEGVFRATYAFQLNLRQEYEQARASVTGPQYDFTLRTHTLDAFLGHGSKELGDGAVEGGVGLSGTFQENVYRGLPLIPNYRTFQGGLYGYERYTRGRASVEAGARYDHLSRTAFLTEAAFERDLARGTLTEADCTRSDSAARCPAAYDAATFSLGGVFHALPDRLDARLDLSSATRFPNADELYMNGSAPTAPVYALGDPSLGVETTWGASPTVGLRLPWLEAEASTYANVVDSYVYFAPELGPSGTPAFDVTIQGAFPRYAFRAVDALFYGFDGGLTLGPTAPVSLVVQGSLVRAVDTSTGARLVMIPSDRVQATARLHPPVRHLKEPFAEVSGLYVFEQTHVDAGADLAPPPDAYLLLGAAVGATVPLGANTLNVGLEGSNLLNTRYRDYTSLLRYYADEPGISLRLRLGLEF